MKPIHELSEKARTLLDLMEDEEAEEQAIDEALAVVLSDIQDCAEDYCFVLKQVEADALTIKNEKMRLARRQSTFENRAKRLRGSLLHAMLLIGVQKIKTVFHTISTRTIWTAVVDRPAEEIPEQFQKVTISVDNDAVGKWLKEGDHAASCDWAHLEPVDSLTVR